MTKILFVCTGNIFRSMSAEYVARALAPQGIEITATSAGTIAHPEPVYPPVLERLSELGIDATPHMQRRVTPEILKEQDIVIAMSTDHKDILHRRFSTPSHLFFEAAYGETRGFPDLWEVVPDYATNIQASRDYVRKAVDIIHETMPHLLARLPRL